MRKMTGIMFSLVLLVCFSVSSALSAQHLHYEANFSITPLADGSVMVTGYTGTAQNVYIPQNIQGMTVTAIGEGAFQNKRLTGVTIPPSVRTIENQAFMNNQLTSVMIPDSVVTIGAQAFMSNRLDSINIPNRVIAIGDRAFSGNRLTSITIPRSVITIGDRAFMYNQLNDVAILNNMAVVGNQAFRGNGISSITIGTNIEIDNTAFGNNFHIFYNNNLRRGGIYTWNGIAWAFSEN